MGGRAVGEAPGRPNGRSTQQHDGAGDNPHEAPGRPNGGRGTQQDGGAGDSPMGWRDTQHGAVDGTMNYPQST